MALDALRLDAGIASLGKTHLRLANHLSAAFLALEK